MAFKTRWECEYCGYTIWAIEQPEDYECPCYDHEKKEHYSEENVEEEEPKPESWDKDERKERYRIAYHIRGGTWEGVTAYMYTGLLGKGDVLMQEAKENPNKVTLLKIALIREEEYMKDKS